MGFLGLTRPKCDNCGHKCGYMLHQGWRHSDYPGYVFGRKKCLVAYRRKNPNLFAIFRAKKTISLRFIFQRIDSPRRDLVKNAINIRIREVETERSRSRSRSMFWGARDRDLSL